MGKGGSAEGALFAAFARVASARGFIPQRLDSHEVQLVVSIHQHRVGLVTSSVRAASKSAAIHIANVQESGLGLQ